MIAARPASAMRCVSVRFGNVLGSQGSVVPVFQEQIRTTQRITITHPGITRYFMTIPEAVSLVLEAYTVGRHGDVLVLDMGEPISIVGLAKTLIRLSGKAEEDVEIIFTGLRAGEKLYEELFYSGEEQLPTSSQKVKRANSVRMNWPTLREYLDELSSLVASGTEISIREKVKQIIPEYQYESKFPASLETRAHPPATPAPAAHTADLAAGAAASL